LRRGEGILSPIGPSLRLLRQHPIHHGIAARFHIVPGRNDFLVGTNCVFAVLAEFVIERRKSGIRVRIRADDLTPTLDFFSSDILAV